MIGMLQQMDIGFSGKIDCKGEGEGMFSLESNGLCTQSFSLRQVMSQFRAYG